MNKCSPRFKLTLIAILLALFVLACNFSATRLPPATATGLNLNQRASDGSVAGSYHYTNGTGNETLQFSVSAEGLASFRLEDASDSETLIVNAKPEQLPHLIWQGQDIDGIGALSSAEQSALDDVLKGDLAHGLAMIPLDIACQGEDAVTPEQLAALLLPLQMKFKYQVTDRSAFAAELAALSDCDYGLERDGESPQGMPVIVMTPANPVPIVLGFFPFDEIGALEAQTTGAGVMMAPFDQALRANYPGITLTSSFSSDPIQNEWGPCEAKCRGACGPDCTRSNCKAYVDDRCEKNPEGENDGYASLVQIYECGTHPACVEHDACYDDCNRRHGCNTFAAAVCRHAGVLDPSNAMATIFSLNISCDRKVINTHPWDDVENWVLGYGPQPNIQVYEYHFEDYRYVRDPINCPRKGDLEPPIPTEEQPEPTVFVPQEEPISGEKFEGETGLTLFYEPLEVRADQFEITVDPDGIVTGLFTYDYITHAYEEDNCTIQYHFAATIDVHGILIDDKGTVNGDHVFTTCRLIGSCQGNIQCGSGPMELYLEKVGDKIEGRYLFTDFPDLIIPFTGNKK